MELKGDVKTFYAKTRTDWRNWLQKNHLKEKSVWLIIYKKNNKKPSIYYPEAVKEALCFGWIDSKANKRDDESYYQYFAKRNPKSNWSKVNKNHVSELINQGLMSEAGLEMVELAKKNGTWSALDLVEEIILPEELIQEFSQYPVALQNWEAFSRSSKRGILEWISNAKRPETRLKRITETVQQALINRKANFPNQ